MDKLIIKKLMRVHIALIVLTSFVLAASDNNRGGSSGRDESHLNSNYLDTVDWFWQSYKSVLTQSHTAQFLRDAHSAYKVFVMHEDPFTEQQRRDQDERLYK